MRKHGPQCLCLLCRVTSRLDAKYVEPKKPHVLGTCDCELCRVFQAGRDFEVREFARARTRVKALVQELLETRGNIVLLCHALDNEPCECIVCRLRKEISL